MQSYRLNAQSLSVACILDTSCKWDALATYLSTQAATSPGIPITLPLIIRYNAPWHWESTLVFIIICYKHTAQDQQTEKMTRVSKGGGTESTHVLSTYTPPPTDVSANLEAFYASSHCLAMIDCVIDHW